MPSPTRSLPTLADVLALPIRELHAVRDDFGGTSVTIQLNDCTTNYRHEFLSTESLATCLHVSLIGAERQRRLMHADPQHKTPYGPAVMGMSGEGIPEPATFVPLDVDMDDQRHGEARSDPHE